MKSRQKCTVYFFVLTGNPVMLAGAMESSTSGACGRGVDGDSPGEGLPPEGSEEGLPLRLRGGVHGHLLPPPQSGVLLCHSEGTGTLVPFPIVHNSLRYPTGVAEPNDLFLFKMQEPEPSKKVWHPTKRNLYSKFLPVASSLHFSVVNVYCKD